MRKKGNHAVTLFKPIGKKISSFIDTSLKTWGSHDVAILKIIDGYVNACEKEANPISMNNCIIF